MSHYDDDQVVVNDDDDQEQHDAYGSIWELVGTYSQSPLEQMLSKENLDKVTLEQVLDEDTFIQEVKAANSKVIEYICQEEHLQRVLEYLSTELYIEDLSPEQKQKLDRAEEEEEDEENKKWFKYPFVASELISCDVEDVNERVVEAEVHIQTILSYLLNKQYNKSALNPSLSQYFTKTISILLQKYYVKIVSVLRKQPNAVQKLLVDSIGLCDMDNLLLKILGFETGDDGMEQDAFGGFSPQQRIRELFLMKQRGSDKELQDRKKEMQHWAAENNLVSLLLQKAEQEKDNEDVVRNVFSFLCEIIEKGVNSVSQKLYSTEVLEQLVDLIVKNHQTSVYTNGIPLLRVIIDNSDAYYAEESDEKPPKPLELVHSRTKDFAQVLQDSNLQRQVMELSHGTLSPPLGESRLKTVEHLQLLFRCKYDSIHKDLLNLQVLQKVIDLFFTYEFNNLLHYIVYGIIQNVLEGESVELKQCLFVDCRLIQRIIKALEENELELKKPKGMRKGNIGFIVELSNLIRKLSFKSGNMVGELTENVEGWKSFIEGPLAELNRLNEKQIGGPVPIGQTSIFQQAMDNNSGSIYRFDDDDEDDDDDEYVDDEDSDDSSDDDEGEVVRQKGNEEEEEKAKKIKYNVQPVSTSNEQDFDADFDNAFN